MLNLIARKRVLFVFASLKLDNECGFMDVIVIKYSQGLCFAIGKVLNNYFLSSDNCPVIDNPSERSKM